MSRNLLLSLLCAIFLSNGCSSTTVIMPKHTEQANAPKQRTSWSFLWGAIEDKRFKNTDNVDCHGSGLSVVTIKTNAAFVLLNVISLGTVMPIRISYDCATEGQVSDPDR